jgi:hypothetical protein
LTYLGDRILKLAHTIIRFFFFIGICSTFARTLFRASRPIQGQELLR